MLRRPPTRLELKVEDMEEWEQVQSEKTTKMDLPSLHVDVQVDKFTMEQRIGYKKPQS